MKSSIRSKAEGTFHEVTGKVEEISGKLSDNPQLEVGPLHDPFGDRPPHGRWTCKLKVS